MESCTICCFKYSDEYKPDINRTKKTLSCHHYLCHSCFIRLEHAHCPFCRRNFTYSSQELSERKALNLDYYKWQPPSQITNYIPGEIIRVRNINRPTLLERIIHDEPFSRVRKNMHRRRRKDLTFEEVLERREMIRKRCKRKWKRKEGNANKESHISLID